MPGLATDCDTLVAVAELVVPSLQNGAVAINLNG
jgi:hypothetical protein